MKQKRRGVTLSELILVCALLGFLGLTVSQTLAPMVYRSEGERILASLQANINIAQTALSQDFRRAVNVVNNCGITPPGCQLTVTLRDGSQILYVWSQSLKSFRRYDATSGWVKLLEDNQAPYPYTWEDNGTSYKFTMNVPLPIGGTKTIQVIGTPRR